MARGDAVLGGWVSWVLQLIWGGLNITKGITAACFLKHEETVPEIVQRNLFSLKNKYIYICIFYSCRLLRCLLL